MGRGRRSRWSSCATAIGSCWCFWPWGIHSIKSSVSSSTEWNSCGGSDSYSTGFPRRLRSFGRYVERPRKVRLPRRWSSVTERSFEERVTSQPARAFLERYYWLRKLQARFFAGDYVSAIDAAR